MLHRTVTLFRFFKPSQWRQEAIEYSNLIYFLFKIRIYALNLEFFILLIIYRSILQFATRNRWRKYTWNKIMVLNDAEGYSVFIGRIVHMPWLAWLGPFHAWHSKVTHLVCFTHGISSISHRVIFAQNSCPLQQRLFSWTWTVWGFELSNDT